MLVKFKKHWPRGTAQLCSLEEALMSGTVMTSGDIFHANQFTSERERGKDLVKAIAREYSLVAITQVFDFSIY